MKLVSALFTVFLSLNSFAASSGNSLKADVLKMGVCTGVNDSEGAEYVFNKNNQVTVRYASYSSGEYANEYCTEYASEYGEEYVSEYCSDYGSDYAQTTSTSSQVQGTWTVKGKQVLVTVQGYTYSLAIGFKSKTCWAQ